MARAQRKKRATIRDETADGSPTFTWRQAGVLPRKSGEVTGSYARFACLSHPHPHAPPPLVRTEPRGTSLWYPQEEGTKSTRAREIVPSSPGEKRKRSKRRPLDSVDLALLLQERVRGRHARLEVQRAERLRDGRHAAEHLRPEVQAGLEVTDRVRAARELLAQLLL